MTATPTPLTSRLRRLPARNRRTGSGPLGALPELSPATRRALVIAALLAAGTAVALVASAWSLATVLASIVAGHADPRPLAVLAGAVLARAMLSWATKTVAARAAATAKEELRARLLDAALARGPEWIDTRGPAELATVATTGLDALDGYFTTFLPALVNAAVVPLLVGADLLYADWRSAVLVAITVPLIPLFAALIGRFTARRVAAAADAGEQLAGQLLELLRALPVLTAFRRARAQAGAVREVSERHRRAAGGTLRVAFLSALVLDVIGTLSVALVAVDIGLRLLSGELGLATGLLVLILAPECYLPLRAAGAAFHASEDGLEAVRRVAEVTGTDRGVEAVGTDAAAGLAARTEAAETAAVTAAAGLAAGSVATARTEAGAAAASVGAEVGSVPKGVRPAPLRHQLTVTDLRVARRDGYAPDGATFSVEAGRITRLDSPSGAGKSTTLAALLGFTPFEGTITVDGVDLSTLDMEAWRQRIAWLPQRPRFATPTMAEELRLAATTAPTPAPTTDAATSPEIAAATAAAPTAAVPTTGADVEAEIVEIVEIAERVAAAHLLHRPVAELSTGERQRVALARALLRLRHGAWLLLLDEPTAHVDRATAAVLGAAITDAADAGAAVLLATHRDLPEPDEQPVEANTVQARETDAEPTGEARLHRLIDLRTALGALLGAGALASGVALTGTAAWLIARAAQHPALMVLNVAIVAVRAFGLGKGVLRYAERLVSHDAAFRRSTRLRVAMWQALVRLGPARTAALRRGDGLRRLVEDTDTVRDLVPRVLQPPLAAALVGLAAVAVQTAILPSAGLTLLVALLLAGLAGPVLGLLAERRASATLANGRRAVAGATLDLLDTAADLIALGAHRTRRAELAAEDAALAALARRQAWAAGLANAIAIAALGGAALVSGWLAATSPANPVFAPVLALLPLALLETVDQLGSALARLDPLRRAYARITTLLTTETPAPTTTPCTGDIVLTDVSARWPGAAARSLSNVDLVIPRGATVAVVGPSGAGKSTLLAVLLGFLTPETGTAAVPADVAWCPQEPQLVATTVRENLRLGGSRPEDTTDDHLRAALRLAALDDWTDRLDVRLGPGGATASGGEATRLALARALLRAPRAGLVLLDEPTAHLDPATARRVLAGLATELAGQTVVQVTHRPAEAVDADLVIEVTGGRVTVRQPTRVGADPAGTRS